MGRLTLTVSKTLACSLGALCGAALVLTLAGCSLTLGPVIERKAIIVVAGVPVEILENRVVECHVLNEVEINPVKQNIGGWVAMPPDHWKTLKAEVERLRKKCGEPVETKKE